MKWMPSGLKRLLSRKVGTVAAVDIGSHHIKALKVTIGPDAPRVIGSARAPTPAGALDDAVNGDLLISALKQVVQDAGVTSEVPIITAIGGNKVITRDILMPVMPSRELEASLKWEAERFIPLPVKDLIVKHVNLGEKDTKEGRRLHILLAAAPRNLVYSYHTLFEAAGLTLKAIDLQAFALWRCFCFGKDMASCAGTVAIVNIGAATTQLVIVRDGEIQFTRSLLGGGNAVTETIAQMQGINVHNNEVGQEDAAATSSLQTELDEQFRMPFLDFVLQTGLGEIARDIRRSMKWYQAQQSGDSVEKVIVSGGGSKFEGIQNILAEQLEIPVEAAESVLTLPAEEEACDPAFDVALGLALREVDTTYRVNILPDELARGDQPTGLRLPSRPVLIGLVSGVLLLGAYGAFLSSWFSAGQELEETRVQLRALEPTLQKVEEVRAAKEKAQARVDAWRGIMNERAVWTPLLDDLQYSLPVDMWFTRVTIGERKTMAQGEKESTFEIPGVSMITIEGSSLSVPSVGVFVRNLQLLSYFSSVEVIEITEDKEGSFYNFKLVCYLGGS